MPREVFFPLPRTTPPPVSLFRALPATSAPSHICETWRNVAQTCLNIKEMGPERPRTNVADPIRASFEPYQVT